MRANVILQVGTEQINQDVAKQRDVVSLMLVFGIEILLFYRKYALSVGTSMRHYSDTCVQEHQTHIRQPVFCRYF